MPFTDSIRLVDVVLSDKSLLTAQPADVVSGRVFIGTSCGLESGTLPVNKKITGITLLAGESHEVAYGMNPSTYVVKATALKDQTIGNATAADILLNKSAWVNGLRVTGTMPNIGKQSATLVSGESVTISKGYHDGTGKITVRALADQTSGTGTAADVLSGKIVWVNGVEITGTMTNNGAVSSTLAAGGSYTVPKGYHNGSGKISAKTLASQTVGNATATDIMSGKTAWVNGKQITGTVTVITPSTITFPINGTYTIPKGYHNGTGKLVQNIPTKGAQIAASAYNAQTIKTTGYYMTGDVTISGIDALNYKVLNTYATKSDGTSINNIAGGTDKATIALTVDNWHDNYTYNVYHVKFSVNAVTGPTYQTTETTLAISPSKTSDTCVIKTTAATITTNLSLQTDTNAHLFIISALNPDGTSASFNITGITITELFACRQFGDAHDVD